MFFHNILCAIIIFLCVFVFHDNAINRFTTAFFFFTKVSAWYKDIINIYLKQLKTKAKKMSKTKQNETKNNTFGYQNHAIAFLYS